MMGSTLPSLSLCCKEVSKEEEILFSNRFDQLQSEGLVSITQATGEVSTSEVFPESPRWRGPEDDQDSGKLPGITEFSTSEGTAAKLKDDNLQDQLTRSIPKGEYTTPDNGFGQVDALELANLERLVARLAGSPLGCVDFERTFRSRQRENHIVVLKNHELDGSTFGEVCGQYSKITILGLKNAAGKAIWAPAPYIRLHSSDELMLIEATPFALAMGLCKEASLAQSSLSPRPSPPGTPGQIRPPGARVDDKPVTQMHDFNRASDDKEKRRCCI